MRVSERNKGREKKGGGAFRSLGGHRRKKVADWRKTKRETPGPCVEGEAEDGGGRGTAGEDGGEGGACECVKRIRG